MDPISALISHINLETLPISPPSKSNITAQQQPTSTGDIPPPQFTSSVDELRRFYTALSAFLSSYDELNNHLNFINSSIDSRLPDHLVDAANPNQSALTRLLETCCDQTITDCPEVIVSEQNPKEIVSDCVRSHEIARTPENIIFSHNYEEIDASKKPLVAEVWKNHVGIDALKKPEVADNHEEIEVCEDPIEIDVFKNHVEIDTSNMHEETVAEASCDQTVAIVLDENPNDMASNGELSHESVRTSESLEEIKFNIPKKPEQIDILNKPAVIDIPMKPELTDNLNKPEQTEICKNPEQIDIMQKPGEPDTLMMIPEEIGTLKKHYELVISMISSEEIDALKKPEESLPETCCDQTITAVPEAIVSEQNPNRMASNGKPSHETVRTPENLEEIDICKNLEETAVLKKPEELDISIIPEEIDTLKKPEESLPETSYVHTTTVVPEAIVSEQNPNRMAANGKLRHENVMTPECLEENDVSVSKKPEQTDILNKPEQTVVLKKPEKIITLNKHEENGTCKKAKELEASKKSVVSELQLLCRSMKSKELKWHVATHYSEMINLREEIANALKLAKDPAKLVLYSIGRFFVLHSRTFCNPNLNKAAILIFECFVMISSDGIEVAKEDWKYAVKVAREWRKRMITHGGLRHSDEVDARGLLLLISGFGIQDHVFKIQDIMDLIKASNVKGISAALRRSVFLIPKIPDVIYLMVKNNLEIEAVDIAYTFGLEDMCHPGKILTTYLHNKMKDIQNVSPLQMLEAVKLHLFDLKSVKQCLESHNIDPSALLPDFKINEKIQNLEKEVNGWKSIDTSKNREETKTLKKPEESLLETSCDQTITAVPEAIVSEQNPNQMVSDGEQGHENVRTPESLEEIDVSVSKNPEQTAVLKKPEQSGTLKKTKEPEASKKSVVSELQLLCRSMQSKEMKWHVATHYSEMINLSEEITNALKLAVDPATLVLYSIGRFFVQGSRTFCKHLGSHQNKQNAGRMAAVLILESFVMISSDGIEIEKRDQEYAAAAAVDWRKRMIKEGGPGHTDEVDARGLLLLISGFGIQDHVFKIQDIIDLIRASNVKEISTALRRSVFLIPKIPEVIYLLVNNDLEIEAVDIVYTFGLEDRCHPRKILTTYLHNKIKDIQNASPLQMMEAVKQHLFDLKSVKQCLESHNIDPSVLLPDFKINEKIQNLEKEVNEWKLIQKRKSLENPIHQEAKRACVSHQNTPHQQTPVDHFSPNRFTRSTQPQPSTSYFDSGRNLGNGYITNQTVSPVYNAVPENTPGSVPNGLAGGFPGYHDQTVHTTNNQPYGWHGPYDQHYSRHGQTYDSQPYHRPWEQGQLESFPGFLGGRAQSSDLYSFAELVEKGLRDSRA